MHLDGFNVHATPFLEGSCRECRNNLTEVSNGFLGSALFCPKCEIVYIPKLVKVPESKVGDEFLQQCRGECKQQKEQADE